MKRKIYFNLLFHHKGGTHSGIRKETHPISKRKRRWKVIMNVFITQFCQIWFLSFTELLFPISSAMSFLHSSWYVFISPLSILSPSTALFTTFLLLFLISLFVYYYPLEKVEILFSLLCLVLWIWLGVFHVRKPVFCFLEWCSFRCSILKLCVYVLPLFSCVDESVSSWFCLALITYLINHRDPNFFLMKLEPYVKCRNWGTQQQISNNLLLQWENTLVLHMWTLMKDLLHLNWTTLRKFQFCTSFFSSSMRFPVDLLEWRIVFRQLVRSFHFLGSWYSH